MENISAKITVFFLILILSSCNAVKRVNDGELLLTKNTIYINDEKSNSDILEGLVYQKPNNLFRLHIFNAARVDPDSVYNEKLSKHLADPSFFDRLISEKQLTQVANYKIDFNNWLKKTGEAPVIISKASTEKSAKRLRLYHDSKGYFNNTVFYSVDSIENKEKRAEISYKVNTGKPYYIDSITKNITSKDLDSIYESYKNKSVIKEGQQFNLTNFEAERERLNNIFSNTGIYKFQPTSISFDIYRDTTMTNDDYKMPVELKIENTSERVGDSLHEIAYKIHKIKEVNIYADYNFNDEKDSLKSITFKNYNIFYKDKLKYRPKALTDAISIIPGGIYKDLDRTLSYRQIGNLKTFKYPNIEYVYADSTKAQLNTNIYLAPRPKFSLGFNTDVSHSNIQDIGVSFSTSVISRNIFRGAETLEISLRGTLGSSKEANNVEDRFFNISEIGGDIKLSFPRIWLPFNTEKHIPKFMSPETRVSFGTTFQKNIGLDKQSFNGIVRYNWSPNAFRKNIFELMNIQFIRNVNPDRFFEVYRNSYNQLNAVAQLYPIDPSYLDENSNLTIPSGTTGFIDDALSNNVPGLNPNSNEFRDVSRINEREQRLTSNNLIFASNFTHTRNSRQGFSDNNFYQFRTKLEIAGNLLSAFAQFINFNQSEDGKNLVFGVPYSQYVKTELDYIKYWQVSRKNVLAFRSFMGLAIPYGNAESVPFIRSYFAGGSNDNRAWQAYTLGPGSTNNVNDFNEANLKIALNLEYRFGLIGDLKGAFFADAGNIWNVLDNIEEEDRVFEGLGSLKELGLGTGVGLRYDFSFFVFRFDIGFKTYNPAYESNKRWFTDYNFGNAVYNIGINYPF